MYDKDRGNRKGKIKGSRSHWNRQMAVETLRKSINSTRRMNSWWEDAEMSESLMTLLRLHASMHYVHWALVQVQLWCRLHTLVRHNVKATTNHYALRRHQYDTTQQNAHLLTTNQAADRSPTRIVYIYLHSHAEDVLWYAFIAARGLSANTSRSFPFLTDNADVPRQIEVRMRNDVSCGVTCLLSLRAISYCCCCWCWCLCM